MPFDESKKGPPKDEADWSGLLDDDEDKKTEAESKLAEAKKPKPISGTSIEDALSSLTGDADATTGPDEIAEINKQLDNLPKDKNVEGDNLDNIVATGPLKRIPVQRDSAQEIPTPKGIKSDGAMTRVITDSDPERAKAQLRIAKKWAEQGMGKDEDLKTLLEKPDPAERAKIQHKKPPAK